MSTSQSKDLAAAGRMDYHSPLPIQIINTATESAPQVYVRVKIQPPSIYGPDNPGEIWRAVVGLEGQFEVSSIGRIRSIPRPALQNIGVGRPSGRILKPTICKKGYERLVVLSQGKNISLSVNRVVAIAFMPNPDGFPYVRHKDTNKLNNRADNLEWTNKRQKSTGMEGQGHV